MTDTRNSNTYIQHGAEFRPRKDVAVTNKLIPGMYEVIHDYNTGETFFSIISHNHDNIVDIPSPEFTQVINEMEFFLKPETKTSFSDYGFLYKRSALLYGAPGTGKTCIVNRVAAEVVKGGGIVLFNPEVDLLPMAFKILEDVQPESMTMVVFEEVNETLNRKEEQLLSILDGEVQKNNVIYLATTNFIEEIPSRICRPGRFSSIIEVGFPSLEARIAYLKTKLRSMTEIREVAEVTEGFSIDELKETVLATKCLGQPLTTVLTRIGTTKGLSKTLPESVKRGKKKQDKYELMSHFDAAMASAKGIKMPSENY